MSRNSQEKVPLNSERDTRYQQCSTAWGEDKHGYQNQQRVLLPAVLSAMR